MPRNILLITDDQHRFDFFGATGQVPALQTPAFDRIRHGGTVMENTYSNSPVCMPTRFTWLHGLYAGQGPAGLLRNAHDWPTGLPSFATVLQEAGYSTALVGKLHSLAGLAFRDVADHEQETRERGFDHVVEVSGKGLSNWFDCAWTRHLESRGLLERYRDRFIDIGAHFDYGEEVPIFLEPEDTMDGFIGAKAREYLAAVRPGRPFFAHVSFCGPHFPLDPPEAYWDIYRDAPMPAPRGVDDPERVELWKQRRRAYCALIHQIDDEIAAILDVLEHRGLLEDTLIIYATDHGDMMGWQDRRHKGRPYETSCRTPYMLYQPGVVPQGQVLTGMTEAVDLPATILEAAGVQTPVGELLPCSPGRSFWRYATQGGGAPRQWAFSEHGSPESGWYMCCEPEAKYVFRPDAPDELYRLDEDPWETDNRVADPAEADTVARLRCELLTSLRYTVGPNTVPCPPVIRHPQEARRGS